MKFFFFFFTRDLSFLQDEARINVEYQYPLVGGCYKQDIEIWVINNTLAGSLDVEVSVLLEQPGLVIGHLPFPRLGGRPTKSTRPG